MDPASAIGLASGLLTFIDIGYKVVVGTVETAQTGLAPHTEDIESVANDLKNAVARFSKPASPSATDPEKALVEVSVRCQNLSTELLAFLERFKAQAAKPGVSWDKFKVVIRRIRCDSKVQELQSSLAEYRSEILMHLVTILGDRQLATQTQLGSFVGETRNDLRGIKDTLHDCRAALDRLEKAQWALQSITRPISDTVESLADQNALLDKLAMQCQQAKDALDRLIDTRSEKTPETRILEHIYFGNSMFQREETLKSADEATFRWFVEGIPSEHNSDSGSRTQHVGQLKAEVSSRFQKWLRSGSGIFHISGKAGSGKSTLMKLILSTERTHELLRRWANGKRLLFARFYFWSGGDQIQNSLEGLQRSVLFEILIQQPDLVKEVFHEAYPIVAHSNWDTPIHSRFFTTASFQKAFKRLLSLPAHPEYRICLFIDGLDEFGADICSGSLPETERENLAQSLVHWTSDDHTKVLASSRPHPEFIDTFVEDQRVHLHQLTHEDMVEFGRHLFERHRVFGFAGVKERYQDLVEKVVHASGGVFLWTGLTIQQLLASLTRHDSFESLERQLRATPRELSALYEEMLLAINEVDRQVAIKMMLLVSEERKHLGDLSHIGGVNAMAIGWLESLEDQDFPINEPFVVYTEHEIEEQRNFADSRVNGYTRGLLEVITHIPQTENHHPKPSYLRHTVQFFHRTALEYVASRSLTLDVLSSSPNLFNLEFYTRLSLAELHFGSIYGEGEYIGSRRFDRYPKIFKKYISTPNPRRDLVEAYRAAFEQQWKYEAWSHAYIGLNGALLLDGARSYQNPPSFDHWVANEIQESYAVQYITERLQSLPELPRQQDDLSLLLSVACRQPREETSFARLSRVKKVLAFGFNPQNTIRLRFRYGSESMEYSVWQAWCLYYVTAKLNIWQGQVILESFLETGVNSDCYILMKDRRPRGPEEEREVKSDFKGVDPVQPHVTERRRTDPWMLEDPWRTRDDRLQRSKTAYVVSLADFIRQAKSANHAQLNQLLDKNDCTQEFSTTMLREIEAELATSKHAAFTSPTVRPVELNKFLAAETCDGLMVYWIRWDDATIPGFLEWRLS